jgi:hypothetical protein
VREPGVEWNHTFEQSDVLGRESDGKSFNISEQMLNLATSNDWKHVRYLLEDVCDRDCIYSKGSTTRIPGTRPCAHSPAVICSVPTSFATFSKACDIFFSSSLRSQCGWKIIRPFSPVWSLRSSSASVRSLPPANTFQGASAKPIASVRGLK